MPRLGVCLVLGSALSLLAACPAGDGAIFLTVDATSGTTLTAVDSLRLTITNGGQTTAPITIVPSGAPIALPPGRTIPLRFERDRSGETMITVAALRAGDVLAMGTTTVQLRPGASVDASIALVGASNPDLGGDMTTSAPDLSVLDLVGVDQTAQPDLVLPDLGTPADLFGCTLAPAKPAGVVVYVAESAMLGGDGLTPTTPIAPAEISIRIADAGSTPITFLMQEGAYPGLAISASAKVTLLGGYYQTFACRDPALHPTTIQSTTLGAPGIGITTGSVVTLDGLSIYGRTDTEITNQAIGVRVATATATIRNCELRSHPPLALAPAAARGLVVIDSSVEVDDSVIRVADATSTLEVVEICNSSVAAALGKQTALVRTQVLASGGNTVGEPYGVVAMGCSSADLRLDRSIVQVDNTGGVSHVVLVSSETDPITVAIDNSVLIASGLHQAVLHGKGAGTKAMTVRASTLSAAFVSGLGMRFEGSASLVLTDSIVKAESPFFDAPPITTSARNLFFGSTANQVYATGASPMLDDYIAAFESAANPSDQSLFADPKFLADRFHLMADSPALGKAACPFATDIDNTPRPTMNCDIGADEL